MYPSLALYSLIIFFLAFVRVLLLLTNLISDINIFSTNKSFAGRAMAQAVSRRSLTAKARVRSRVSPCGFCGGQSATGTGFSPSTSVLPCQFHSTGAPLQGKMEKKLIIFITGLHNKPQGCGASVVSAAGPFTTKKNQTLQQSESYYRFCIKQSQRYFFFVSGQYF